MKIRRTGPFQRDFDKLPDHLKRRAEKVIWLIAENLLHPSLEARIVDKKWRIWKAKVSDGYRLTYQLKDELIVLRRIGSHDKMERPTNW